MVLKCLICILFSETSPPTPSDAYTTPSEAPFPESTPQARGAARIFITGSPTPGSARVNCLDDVTNKILDAKFSNGEYSVGPHFFLHATVIFGFYLSIVNAD